MRVIHAVGSRFVRPDSIPSESSSCSSSDDRTAGAGRPHPRDRPTGYPFNPDGLIRLGAWLSKKGRPAEAVKLFELAVKEFPTYPPAVPKYRSRTVSHTMRNVSIRTGSGTSSAAA